LNWNDEFFSAIIRPLQTLTKEDFMTDEPEAPVETPTPDAVIETPTEAPAEPNLTQDAEAVVEAVEHLASDIVEEISEAITGETPAA
jgi:hypothetical protein